MKKVENVILESFGYLQVLEKIEKISALTQDILDAENITVWFKNSEDNNFWSFDDDKKIFSDNSYFENISTTEDRFIEKIESKSNNEFVILDIIGIKNKNFESIEILSLFVSQAIETKDVLAVAKYYLNEQNKAYSKQKFVIQNDLTHSNDFDVKTFYKPSDILNGDSYSIYKTINGDIFAYVIDAMGHGIGPSLTAYSISAIIQQQIRVSNNFNNLMESLLDNIQYILTDEEQITCGFFWFSKDLSKVEYVVAGMYAPMILDGDKIISAKANNIPFMNFAFDFSITTIELADFKRFMIFTDGLVEDTQELNISLEKMMNDEVYYENITKELNLMHLEDDTTILKFSKKNL